MRGGIFLLFFCLKDIPEKSLDIYLEKQGKNVFLWGLQLFKLELDVQFIG
jgi:hypothetical protein